MKTGIVITCFNRPEYFEKCLSSLRKADIPPGSVIILVNDASTDIRTNNLFDSFNIYGMSIIKYMNEKNSKISFSLRLGMQRCFDEGCQLVINLDADAIVKPNFIQVLSELKVHHPHNIVTGFNSINKQKSGIDRHPIIKTMPGYHLKKSVGGINMAIYKEQFDKWLRPTFDFVLSKEGNWDYLTCIAAMKDNLPIVVSIPSVVQHIGFDSSMGHNTEEPDVACDFDIPELELSNITLIGIDCLSIHRLIEAAGYCTKNIKFGAVKLLTSLDIQHKDVVKCRKVSSKEDYSYFMMKELYKYIDTEYCLLFQYDGYVVNYKAWNNNFLNYDYIGATWWYKDGMNVGNGGFSLRSKKLLTALKDEKIVMYHPEDHHICRTYKSFLESKHGIKFASEEVANKFSIEACFTPDNKYQSQFGFHGQFVDFTGADIPHIPYKPGRK